MLTVERIINTPVTSNCFVIYDNTNRLDCIIVDPATKNNEELLAFISSRGLIPKYIILTHEHFDHCWGVNDLVERFDVRIICSSLCTECIKNEKRNCSVFYDNKEAFVINCGTISIESINQTLRFAGEGIHFFNTPGHTDASVSFMIDDLLFTGDALIKDEKTVTKLPTGSVQKLKETIDLFDKMQGNGYKVFPGHGECFELDGYDLNLSLKGM